MHKFFCFLLVLAWSAPGAQPSAYSVANAHSHNDYEKEFPFRNAYNRGFGSIEADIFLHDDKLIVAHDSIQLKLNRTLDSLYLQPLQNCIAKNNGYVYADTGRQLQLLVDIKSGAKATLDKLIQILGKYPLITGSRSVKIVISGNRPDPSLFISYPEYIFFDGELNKEYTAAALERIVLLSDNLRRYTSWNGKGIIPGNEKEKIEAVILKAHQQNKKVRFWNSPDDINSWLGMIRLHVDFVNTDKIDELATFLKQLPERTYSASSSYKAYEPRYRNDGTDKPVKNVILLIGDGTGLAQLYAGYTANRGVLNVFNMKYTGLSKTSSYDSYITDSAPGSTAFSSGVKTNNRWIGVDHNGKALKLLPDILQQRKMKTGIVTCGDITDATPADFYAHQSERSYAVEILNDLAVSTIDIIMGAPSPKMTEKIAEGLRKKFKLISTLDSVEAGSGMKWIVTEKRAGLSMLEGRGDWLQKAFDKTTGLLSKNKNGFFLMLEGAQVDYGGHYNKLPYVVAEVMDFDKTIGKAMQFADGNGETLVIVTADHETGGLTLTDGDYKKGYVNGQFSTNDHTAIPVPVFAYGPQSQLFSGVYENTEIFFKILKALKLSSLKQ